MAYDMVAEAEANVGENRGSSGGIDGDGGGNVGVGGGVLELYQMDTYVCTHYLKFQLSRVSQQEGNAHLLTLESYY
jgi:hypothetical protein